MVMGRAGWPGRIATCADILASGAALLFLMLRGLSCPDQTASTTPWHMRRGFIAGVPAIPWIMPFLVLVLALRRVGREVEQGS